MIRLPTTTAAITAPLLASDSRFVGIPIGRSATDGRPFHLSPVLVDARVLPSTNSLALGGLGSGKSATAKVRARREILHHQHQYVVVDSFGEEETAGEWAPLVRSLGGKVIKAGQFTLNPCSNLLPVEVREQLVRSLIEAVEPNALTPQATHALQHALNSPKASGLTGLVDALVSPEDGRWPAVRLTEWGEAAAIALSRYTEGSLRGLFDGPDAGLPETDLPIISFDFSHLDRNSPAIPALMAAIACWIEHVWLKQSTAPHRHLVIEEAWQILLSPVSAELIQRLVKNSRKAALSLDVVMHTLSDLGEGRAQDIARLCEIAHVGRLGPEEAAIVGDLLGLPAWAIQKIPNLEPGEAIWKVGPGYIDIVQTTLSKEERELTDTSKRRRAAQGHAQRADEAAAAPAGEDPVEELDEVEVEAEPLDPATPTHHPAPAYSGPQLDARHHLVLQAAGEGRLNEAGDIAAIGERADIAAYGINSPQATAWLVTRAEVAEQSGDTAHAQHLRATVAHMGNTNGGWSGPTETTTPWHHAPTGPDPLPQDDDDQQPRTRRRTWPYIAALVALPLTLAGVWQATEDDARLEEQQQKTEAYTGRSGATLTVDAVDADVHARWTRDGERVIVKLGAAFDRDATFLRLDGGGKTAQSQKENGWHPEAVEIELPVSDRHADVTVRVAIGGKTWTDGIRATSRSIRLSPTGAAYDAETGKQLPSDI